MTSTSPIGDSRRFSPTGALVGGASGLVVGVATARTLKSSGGRFALIAGGLTTAGAVAGGIIGARLTGSNAESGGRTVGVAYGRKMLDNPDGTQTWAQVRSSAVLGASVGARDGYATLVDAVAATSPLTRAGDTAYVRELDRINVYALRATQLDAVEAVEPTDPTVVAYTTRLSGSLHAGPGATTDDRRSASLAPPPPPPF